MGFDPVSIGFAAMFAASSAGISGGAALTAIFAIASTVTGALPIALALGYQSYVSYQAKKQLQALNNTDALQQIIKQAIPPQRLVLGRTAAAGALFFYRVKKPYLYYGFLLASHECGELESIFINGHTVAIGPDGFATSSPYSDGSNQYIKASYRNGDIDQAIDPIIAADFPDMPTTFRQRGHATIVVRAHYGFGGTREAQDDDHKEKYGDSGSFNPVFRFKGAKVYDPRDVSQTLADPDTWKWSDNAALCLCRYLTHRWPDTQILTTDQIDWSKVAVAADDCDQWQACKDGTSIRTSTVNGIVQSNDEPFDVIESMKLAMTGTLVLDRGKVYPVALSKKEPIGTLHVGMIRGGFQYIAEPRRRDTANIVTTNFVSGDREFQTVTGPVIRNEDFIAADGRAREIAINLSYVEDHRRAQRKAYIDLMRSRLGRTLSCQISMEGFDWNISDVVRVDFPEPLHRPNGLYLLNRKVWNDSASAFDIVLTEYDATILDWSPATQESDFTVDEEVIAA